MITIVIVNDNSNLLIKTLISIYMQTEIDKIKTVLINLDNKTNKKIDAVKEKVINEEYNVSNRVELLDSFNKIIKEEKSKYLLFIKSSDLLFDKYSIKRIFNKDDNSDLVLGSNQYFDGTKLYFSTDELFDIYGICYRIEFLRENNLYFPNIEGYENKCYNSILLNIKHTTRYSYDYFIKRNSINEDDYTSFVDYLNKMTNKKIYYFDRLADIVIDKYKIAREVYELLVIYYFDYLEYDSVAEHKDIIKYIKMVYEYYKKYERYLTIDDKNNIYMKKRKNIIIKQSFDDFIEVLEND